MKKRNVIGKREVNSYMFLLDTSFCALERAREKQPDNLFNDCLTVMVFSAFSLEAFLNHLGLNRGIPDWEWKQGEHGRRWRTINEKLEILVKSMGFEPDMSQGIFQTFGEIFRFRNSIAHAHTEELEYQSQKILPGEPPSPPLTDWEKITTLKNAEKFFKTTIEIIEKLHLQSGADGGAFRLPWKSSWSVS